MGAKFGKPYATLILIFVESGALTTLAKTTALIDFECAGAFIVPFCVSAFLLLHYIQGTVLKWFHHSL